MTTAPQFNGFHPETGSFHNALSVLGVPISEGALLIASGGITGMYFVFEYEGLPPILFVGTRSTFEPTATIINRLGLPVQSIETTSANRAADYLKSAVADGRPAIVWGDRTRLAHRAVPVSPYPESQPFVVLGMDGDSATIADGSLKPIPCAADQLTESRGAHRGLKHLMIRFDGTPNTDKLASALESGLKACVSLYLDAPPKGPKSNFGLDAFDKWAKLIVDAKDKKGWPTLFPNGAGLFDALTNLYKAIHHETGGNASRGIFADGLDEAVVLLNRPTLKDAANAFRSAGEAWRGIGLALLPDDQSALKAARETLDRSYVLYRADAAASVDERRALTARLADLRAEAGSLTDTARRSIRERLHEAVKSMRDQEARAVELLR